MNTLVLDNMKQWKQHGQCHVQDHL